MESRGCNGDEDGDGVRQAVVRSVEPLDSSSSSMRWGAALFKLSEALDNSDSDRKINGFCKFTGSIADLGCASDERVRVVTLQMHHELRLVTLPLTRGSDTSVMSEPTAILVLLLVVQLQHHCTPGHSVLARVHQLLCHLSIVHM